MNIPRVTFHAEQLLGGAVPLGDLCSSPRAGATEEDDAFLHLPA